MLWPFQKKRKLALGIDIGTSSIKVVQLEKVKNAIRLVTYGDLYRVNDYAAQANFPKLLDEQVARMLRFLLKETKIIPVPAMFGIPVFSSFVTVIEMPHLTTQEIAKAIPFEARQYVPVPISEVVLDWSIIRKGKPKEETQRQKKTQVLLVAIPKDIVQQYNRIAQLANVQVEALEMEAFSVVRAVIGGDKRPMLIIDIGARSSSVTIVDEGVIRFTHSLDVSGKDMTRALVQGININWERAEALKREEGLEAKPGRGGAAELLRSVLNIIMNDVERVSRLYYDRTQRQIEKVLLTGGTARMPGFTNYVVQRLGREAFIGDPFVRLQVPSELRQTIIEIGPSFTVAVGLALHNIETSH